MKKKTTFNIHFSSAYVSFPPKSREIQFPCYHLGRQRVKENLISKRISVFSCSERREKKNKSKRRAQISSFRVFSYNSRRKHPPFLFPSFLVVFFFLLPPRTLTRRSLISCLCHIAQEEYELNAAMLKQALCCISLSLFRSFLL